MKKEIILIGQATPAQITEWKNKHKRGVYALSAEGHIAYFREPDIEDYNLAASTQTASAPFSYFEMLLKETKLGGSDELLTNPTIFINVSATVKSRFESVEVEVVNL